MASLYEAIVPAPATGKKGYRDTYSRNKKEKWEETCKNSRTVYIGNLNCGHCEWDGELYDLLSAADVDVAMIWMGRVQGNPVLGAGFAFAQFSKQAHASRACRVLSGYRAFGRTLKVDPNDLVTHARLFGRAPSGMQWRDAQRPADTVDGGRGAGGGLFVPLTEDPARQVYAGPKDAKVAMERRLEHEKVSGVTPDSLVAAQSFLPRQMPQAQQQLMHMMQMMQRRMYIQQQQQQRQQKGTGAAFKGKGKRKGSVPSRPGMSANDCDTAPAGAATAAAADAPPPVTPAAAEGAAAPAEATKSTAEREAKRARDE